jgi:hypothetical protein
MDEQTPPQPGRRVYAAAGIFVGLGIGNLLYPLLPWMKCEQVPFHTAFGMVLLLPGAVGYVYLTRHALP